MARPEQIIRIEPQNELKFMGPFNVPVTSFMKLINPTDKTVVFKIKTTAPKKYCVRPNSGFLDPNSVTEIAICLQPFIFDPAEKNKHKFMVQTIVVNEDEKLCVDALWKDISTDKVMDSKLKCVFEVPPTDPTPNAVSENNDAEKETNRVQEVKTSPKGTSATKINGSDADLVKAAQEIKQLREDESNLRQENLQLKEEIIRLKHSTGPLARETSKYTPMATVSAPLSIMHVFIAMGIAIVGIILGKFCL